MMSRYSRGIWRCGVSLAMGLGVLCLAHTATGTEVMTGSNTATWNRLHSSSVTLSWDWSWEWVPAEAASVQVTVRGARHRQVLNQTFARGGATSTTLDIGAVTAASEDVYTATLAFLNGEGATLASRTADLYALAGSFGNARVCTKAADDPDWHRVTGSALIPYDATWNDETSAATNGTLTVAPAGKDAFVCPFARSSGVMPVKGNGETSLTLEFGDDETDPLIASLYWVMSGMRIIFR